jgi:predicted NACHT family NTPase
VASLNATIFDLDTIFLEVQFGEEFDAVNKSQLFKPYVVDIEPSVSRSEEIFGDFDSAFEKYNHRVLLLGKAGAGKSTTLISLAKSLIEERLKNRSSHPTLNK